MKEEKGKGCLKGFLIVFVVVTVIIIALLGIGLFILTATKNIDKADCVSEVSLTTSENAVLFLINSNSGDISERHYFPCIDNSYAVDKCGIRYASSPVMEVPLGSQVDITGRVKGTLPFSSWTYNRQKIINFEAVVNGQKVWINEQVMASFFIPTINTFVLTQSDIQNEQALMQLGFNTATFDSPIYVSKLQSNWQCGKY